VKVTLPRGQGGAYRKVPASLFDLCQAGQKKEPAPLLRSPPRGERRIPSCGRLRHDLEGCRAELSRRRVGQEADHHPRQARRALRHLC